MQIGCQLADRLQHVDGAHAVDFEVFAVVEGAAKGRGNVVHRIDSCDSAAHVGEIAQIAFDGLDAVKAVELVGAALVAGIDETADVVPFVEQGFR